MRMGQYGWKKTRLVRGGKNTLKKLMNEENSGELREKVQVEVHTVVANITCSEIEKALKKMKSGKVPGVQHLLAEVWKILGAPALEYLQEVLNKIVEDEKILADWRNYY